MRNHPMKINYVLPFGSLTGRVSAFTEISKRLIAKKHEVSTTFPARPEGVLQWQARIHYPPPDGFRRLAILSPSRFLMPNLGEDIMNVTMEHTIPECDINVATFCMTTYPFNRSGKGLPYYHMQHHEPLFFDDARLKKMAEATYFLLSRRSPTRHSCR